MKITHSMSKATILHSERSDNSSFFILSKCSFFFYSPSQHLRSKKSIPTQL